MTTTERQLLSASRDRTVALWEVDSWTLTNKSRAQINWINALEVFEREILSGSESAFVQTWGILDGIKKLEAHDHIVTSLVALRDGFLASACSEGFIKIWDLKSFTTVTSFKGHSDFIHSMVELQNGCMVTGSFDGSIKIWNTVSWREERILNPPFKFVSVIALPNGSLACRTLDSVRILDSNDGHEIASLASLDVPLSLAALPDNLLAIGCSSGRIQILDLGNRSRNASLQMKSNNSVTSIVALGNNQAFASGNAEGNISIWSMKEWIESIEMKGESELVSLAAHSDQFLLSGHESCVIIWRTSDGAKLNQLNKSHGTYSLVGLPNGTMASGNLNGIILLWNTVRPTQIGNLSSSFIDDLRVFDDHQHDERQDSVSVKPAWSHVTDSKEKSQYDLSGGVLAMKCIGKSDLVVGTRNNEIRNYYYELDCSKHTEYTLEDENRESSFNSMIVDEDGSFIYGFLDGDIFIMNTDGSNFKRFEFSKQFSSESVCCMFASYYIVSGFKNGLIIFWDIEDDYLIAKFKDENDSAPVSVLALLGDLLVSGYENGLIKVWTKNSPIAIHILKGYLDEGSPSKKITRFAVLDQGLFVSSCFDNTIKIWNCESWTEVEILSGYKPLRLVVLNNGYLASGNEDGSVIVWNTNDWTEFRRLAGFNNYSVSSLIVLPNDFLVSSSRGGVKIWDTIDWTEVKTPEEFTLETTQLTPIENGFRFCGIQESVVHILDFKISRHLLVINSHTDWVTSLAYLKGSLIASGSKDSTIKIWSATDWSKIRTLREHQDSVNALAVVRDEYLVSGSSDQKIIVWNTSDFSIVQVLLGHTDSVTSLAVSPNGLLASGSDDCTVRIWKCEDRNVIHVLSGHSSSVTSLVFVSDEELVSGSADGTMCVWSTEDGELVKSQSEHKFQITALVFIESDSAEKNQETEKHNLVESETKEDM